MNEIEIMIHRLETRMNVPGYRPSYCEGGSIMEGKSDFEHGSDLINPYDRLERACSLCKKNTASGLEGCMRNNLGLTKS